MREIRNYIDGGLHTPSSLQYLENIIQVLGIVYSKHKQMILKSLATTLLILFYTSSFGQVEWAAKCGFNFSNTSERGSTNYILGPEEEYGTSLGLHLGFLAGIKLSEQFTFQPEIQFSQKGVNNKTRGTNFTLNYLEIPIMASVSIVKPISIEFGPTPGLLLSNSTYKTFDFGLSAGMQVKITGKLGITARYTHGLIAIATMQNSDINGNIISEYRQYNRCLQLGIVYKLKS